jgi:predicted Zn finger-like uncharacterized protein
MIVVCEQCQTRFRLAKNRLPTGGARVRCSRCQHTFHVKPEPPARDKHSIVRRVVEDTAPIPSKEDLDLENPEFLHGGPPASERDSAPASAARSESDDAVLGLDAETESEIDDEPVLGSEGPEEPSLGSPQEDEEPPSEPVHQRPPTELDLTAPPTSRPSEDDLSAGLEGFRLDGPIEERGPGWQPSGAPGPSYDSPPDSIFEPGVFDPDGSSVEEEANRPPKASRQWKLPRLHIALPIASAIAGLLRLLAWGVGLALIVAAGRAALVFSLSGVPEPDTLRGAGWTATSFETFHAHGFAGERLLVVRGALSRGRRSSDPTVGATPPRISGRLLDVDGNPLGREVRASSGRLDDAALAPDRLADLLAAQAESPPPRKWARSRRAASQEPKGFTLLFNDPPPDAVRIQINMRSPTDLKSAN